MAKKQADERPEIAEEAAAEEAFQASQRAVLPPKPEGGAYVSSFFVEQPEGEPVALELGRWVPWRERTYTVEGQTYEVCGARGADWVYRAVAF